MNVAQLQVYMNDERVQSQLKGKGQCHTSQNLSEF